MEIEKTFKNDPGTCDGSIGILCKLDNEQIIFNTDKYSQEECEYMEIDFMEKHKHGKPIELAREWLEEIWPLGKTPVRKK